ncbi:Proline iminopeptidase aneH [Psilocybe cubensis]|uniref:Proline iminopeptidase aneH n=1 Tax=Psilocybe cubensis TaxID=181762 RepID=A0ACB8HDF2_PSICU|nr:Proline iminopeptidase aneH [Psilocybe cubensis]KAH9485732.1 Proline iminopeptidase aneH [Psilocybe cubensis]
MTPSNQGGAAAKSSIVHESYTIKEGLKIIERFFSVPLDYSKPKGERITIFARNVIPKSKAPKQEDEAKLPFCGPGFEINLPSSGGYVGEIHDKGYQTLWVDQRGTGLSTPLSPDTLPEHVKTDEEIAQYLKHFRADNIVRDCEFIRLELLGHKELPEDKKWTLLGQSFGGFCAITYLSFHSEGVKEVFITGGLAPLVEQPDLVYETVVHQVLKRNEAYYRKYPQDIKRIRDILAYLDSTEVILPNGGQLTPRRWQQLGINFGMHGGIDSVHQLVFRASNDLALFKKISYKTLQSIQNQQTFDGNPLYAILHEPIYCQGQAANWSAARTVQNFDSFSWQKVKAQDDSSPIFFTGEMIFPHMFDDYTNLRPWKGAAEILARDSSWGPLYDLDQLKKNEVKVSAVTYFNDMYVDFSLAQRTAATIQNTEQYITNQLVHDGIRKDSVDVMRKLFKLSKREFD